MFVGTVEACVADLLARANDAERTGKLTRAGALFAQAVSLDDSPRARFEAAAFLARTGDEAGAIVEWQRIWEALSGPEHAELAATISHNLAGIYRQRGDWALARRWQQRSAAQQAGGSDALQWTADPSSLIGAANDAMACRKWGDAERFLAAALRISRLREDCAGEADALGTCGVLLQLQGKLSAAVRCFANAIPLHRHAGDDQGAAIDCLNLATVCVQQGRPRAALSAAKLAVRHAARSGVISLIARANETTATLRRALQQLDHPAECN